ncbi:MAG: ComEA family DNA-binding protein [Thermodesulfobacteriota bacterium]
MIVYRKSGIIILAIFLAVVVSGVFFSASAEDSKESVNINTASEKQLTELKGIGPVTAERIIDYREENGGFSDEKDLQEVKGVGAKTVADIQDQITAEPASD